MTQELPALELSLAALRDKCIGVFARADHWELQRETSRATAVDLEARKRHSVFSDQQRLWAELREKHELALHQVQERYDAELRQVEAAYEKMGSLAPTTPRMDSQSDAAGHSQEQQQQSNGTTKTL